MRLSLFTALHWKVGASPARPGALQFSRVSKLLAGGHGGAAIPVPIPNTEVKRPIAEGSASLGRARVGRRRLIFLCCHDAGGKALENSGAFLFCGQGMCVRVAHAPIARCGGLPLMRFAKGHLPPTAGYDIIIDTIRKCLCRRNRFAWKAGRSLAMHLKRIKGAIGQCRSKRYSTKDV